MKEAAVLLDMGLGKSVITLTAIQELCLNAFEISRVLVIAPLRVARDTWPAEIQKWDHLRDLSYSVAVGTEKERLAALMRPAFLHIINRENVQWLVEDSGLPFRYDMIVIDELSSFKSWQAKRFKSLLKVRPSVKRRPDGHTQQQRPYGSVGRVPAPGHGPAARTVYHPVPRSLLCSRQAQHAADLLL